MVYICVYTHTQTEQNFARMKIRGKGMEQTMIKTENVSKRFGSFALQDIHFELPAGYICGLIGENGVGKTTLLNILAGLYEYDGTISIQEKEYRTNQMELQQDIGFVFHEEWFDDWDSLIANSRHYGKYYKNYDETLLKEYLKRFRLDGKKKYKKLSKGEKLKFAFAFALAHHPKLLLLDEPGANFDQTFREEFHHILPARFLNHAGIYDKKTQQVISTKDVLLKQMDQIRKLPDGNTTIGCIVTNVKLNKAQ